MLLPLIKSKKQFGCSSFLYSIVRLSDSSVPRPPEDFIFVSQKAWHPSLLSYFISANFAFKLVEEEAEKQRHLGINKLCVFQKSFYFF